MDVNTHILSRRTAPLCHSAVSVLHRVRAAPLTLCSDISQASHFLRPEYALPLTYHHQPRSLALRVCVEDLCIMTRRGDQATMAVLCL
jgi:hypothetical protein